MTQSDATHDTTRGIVGLLSEFDIGQMKMARVGEHRLVVAK